jgi:single-strand DNA-binding protein
MARSMNKWIGVGNVGQQPDVKYTQGGGAVCNFNVACSERFKDKSGEQQERTEWVRCVAFGKLAELCGEYLQKGSRVTVEGRLSTREYEKDNIKRQVTEVVLSEVVFPERPKGERSDAQPAPQKPQPRPQAKAPTPPPDFGTPDYASDDVPF